MYNAFLIYFIFLVLVFLLLLYLASRFRIKRPIRFILLVLLVVISPAVIMYMTYAYFSPVPETIVPDVVGLNEQAAIDRLESLGLEAKVESRNSDSSIITSQRPEPGKIVKLGRVISISIGKLSAQNAIPSSVVVTPEITKEAQPTSEIQIEVIPQQEKQND